MVAQTLKGGQDTNSGKKSQVETKEIKSATMDKGKRGRWEQRPLGAIAILHCSRGADRAILRGGREPVSAIHVQDELLEPF